MSMTTPPPLLASLVERLLNGTIALNGAHLLDSDGVCGWLSCGDIRQAATALEALAAENAKLTRDRDTLMMFAQSIQTWRVDADSYDRECGHVARDYCEDVDLMQASATNTLRRIKTRATLDGATQP